MTPANVKLSRFLSLVLRHRPAAIGISLDNEGWVDVNTLLDAARKCGTHISRATLDEVVFSNDKQRFAFSADGLRIRANQGHSIAVRLHLEPKVPPELLYHGTATRFLESIIATGLEKRGRQYVHLSATPETARNVGARHGKPMVLVILAARMHAEGHLFYVSSNGVWLTDAVPSAFIREASAIG